ncbi:uncharacterized lipoprotein syc1174_c-like isoform X3 [Telopea speciosissima]|uniref:uncharacterized lipoprotein syc1174_c-like isoform X3 n=1 Tax=Telopea speciosissima TaxID=54955 RepID=UPI001CC809A2|nr:uncharacterized lipoprotein syc1174_c-like isoform X3 [Telopea speciosissima]
MALHLHLCSSFSGQELVLGRRWKHSFPKKTTQSPNQLSISCGTFPFSNTKFRRPYTSVMIVPTGVGASIGGFAGDALPVARTLASVVDCLISHPNVLNAAMLYWPLPNVLYVEGHALDRFAQGSWALQPIHRNKQVGLVLDAGIEEELRIRHLQVADATRASLGLPVVEYVVTDTPLQVEKWVDHRSGQSTGRIRHPDSLLRAVHTLVNHSQVNAIAVVGRFPDDDVKEMEDYRQGKIGYTFLPCVLAGLCNAPQYVAKDSGTLGQGCILASDVDSVVIPIDACGGEGTLAFARSLRHKPLIIAVEENQTVLDDTPDKLGIKAVKVSNYWEAVGVIAAHKAGVDPNSLRRNGINNIRLSSVSPCNGYLASNTV